VSSVPHLEAVRFKEGRGAYRSQSWAEYGQMIREMAAGLASMGFEPGQRAAILSNTSHLWVASDLAIMANGAVSVPIYPTSSQSDIQYIIDNSDAQFVFVQNESLLNKVLAVKGQLPGLKKVVLLSALPGGKSLSELKVEDGLVLGLEELQECGRQYMADNDAVLDQRMQATESAAVATIIYTSGTTGTPKGVMLTYDNIFGVLNDLPAVIPITPQDVYLSFLPLSHVFERICGEFYWLAQGDVCAFAEGIEHVSKNMSEVEPSMILVVPRVLDRIYAKVRAGIMGASGRSRSLIEWSLEVGKDAFRHKAEGKMPGPFLNAKVWLAERLVFAKLRARIGRNLRLVVSGGAPATKEVIEFFNAIGITTLEGYGLTETTAPVSVNVPSKVKAGTVGKALRSTQIMTAEDGEIMIKGPGVFKGYFKADEQTAESFDENGWFHTGDIGIIDGDGYVKITDRKKDLIINSAGKNIAPQRIEAALKQVPIVSQAIVFGDKKKHTVAILTLDEHGATELAHEKGWHFNSYAELSALPELKQHLRREINECSKQLADYERVRNIAVLSHDLSVEHGELTATLKVKRNVVLKKYKDLVDKLYKEDESLVGSAR
jgi:long-chain acyl-CoA synthetase